MLLNEVKAKPQITLQMLYKRLRALVAYRHMIMMKNESLPGGTADNHLDLINIRPIALTIEHLTDKAGIRPERWLRIITSLEDSISVISMWADPSLAEEVARQNEMISTLTRMITLYKTQQTRMSKQQATSYSDQGRSI